jgi:hypothetical protein
VVAGGGQNEYSSSCRSKRIIINNCQVRVVSFRNYPRRRKKKEPIRNSHAHMLFLSCLTAVNRADQLLLIIGDAIKKTSIYD